MKRKTENPGDSRSGFNRLKVLAILTALFMLSVIVSLPGLFRPVYGAEIPKGNAEHGYVESITFEDLGRGHILDYGFEQGTTEYDICLPETYSGGFTLRVPQEVLDQKEVLYYSVYVNGVDKTGAKRITDCLSSKKELLLFQINNAPVGKTTTVSIRVGVADRRKNFIDSDVYNYHITRRLALLSLWAKAGEGEEQAERDWGLLRSSDKGAYTDSYTYMYEGNKICFRAGLKSAGEKLYIGEKNCLDMEGAVGSGKEIEFPLNLAGYRDGDTAMAVIPFSLRYETGEGETLRKDYTVYVGGNRYMPVIERQPPAEVSVKKHAQSPLEIKAREAGGGSLSYQWVEDNVPVKDATGPSFQPPTDYAGKRTYWCVVTNHVGGAAFEVRSSYVKYTTELDGELAAPEITIQPRVSPDVNEGRKTFYVNGTPELQVGLNKDIMEEGVTYEVEIYKNNVNATRGGEKIDDVKVSDNQGINNSKIYTLHLPPQNDIGTRYYYIVATASGMGMKPVSSVSKTLKLIFKDLGEVVTGLEGRGSETDPFLIKNADDLQYVKNLVEGREEEAYSFSGQTLAFTTDITLPKDWEPIGNLKDGETTEGTGKNLQPFCGILDGKGHTLTVADHGKPLFNYVRKATVKNLAIQGSHIDGFGLVESYTVDYGESGVYANDPVKLRTIDIRNVTIKSGTKILKSGLIGGYASGVNAVNLWDCTVEKGVEIGYNKDQDHIGSFAGEFNGTMQNCVSYADVYGRETVGGLIGNKGQSMGPCDLANCFFKGTVTATGDKAGGLMGAGYIAGSAPGTPVVQIHNCYADAVVTGKDKVGGIIGSEEGHHNYNDTGDAYGITGANAITDTFFYGKLQATGGKNVGGIIGYLHDFTKKSGEASNYFPEGCGASGGIGGVKTGEIVGMEKHSAAIPKAAFTDGTLLTKLNGSVTSYRNWEQGREYPVLSDKPVIVGLKLGGDYKTTYYIGEALDFSGMTVTVCWSDGREEVLGASDKDIKISGYDSQTRGLQKVTVRYGVVLETVDVTVLKKSSGTITVYLRILGDEKHDSEAEGAQVHTLSGGNLTEWLAWASYAVDGNATVKDVVELALAGQGWTCENPTGNYIESITRGGVTIGEFTNGKMSGWMYALNHTHPLLGVSEQYLEDGDEIILHYTDDYDKESAFPDGNTPADPSKPVSPEIAASVKGNVAVAMVPQADMDALAGQAAADKAPEVVLKITGADQAGKIITELPGASLAGLADRGLPLTVKTAIGLVSLDTEALKAAAAAGQAVQIVLEKQEISKEHKNLLGASAVSLAAQILSGSQEVTGLSGGKITVYLPAPGAYDGKTLAAALEGQDGTLSGVSGETVSVDGKSYFRLTASAPGTFVLAEAEAMDAAIQAQESPEAPDRPAAGTSLTDSKTGQAYTVNKGGSTVTYKKPKNKNVTTAAVPATVTLDGKSYQVTAIAAGAFSGCTKLKTVSIGKNVTGIGKKAFYGCKKLTKITVPGKVKTIGDQAFSGCTALKTAAIGKNVTDIGAKAFYGCKKLAKITVPDKVKTIGDQAFSGCTGLTKATVGKAVTGIGKKAFYGCKKLKSITIKTTKLTSKKVGAGAFKGINAKATIKVPKNKKSAYKKLLKAKGIGKKVKIK